MTARAPGDPTDPASKDPEHLYRTGLDLAGSGRLAAARGLLEKASGACPQRADMAYNLGVLSRMAGDLPAAVAAWQRAVALAPEMPDALFNLGRGLTEQGRHRAAQRAYRRLLAIDPGHTDARYNLGNLLAAEGDFKGAEACYASVVDGRPDHADAWVNLGLVMKQSLNLDRAAQCYRRALAIAPEHADAHWNLSHLLMLREDWAAGWREYEWRLRRREAPTVLAAVPRWDGGKAPHARLVLWAEQGVGDAIQFLRYAGLAARRVGRVTVACHPSLVRLAATAPGVHRAASFDTAVDGVDVQAPLMSLPHLMQMTDPGASWTGPYLSAPAGDAAVPATETPAVGLVWAGNPGHANDRHRSIPRALLAPLDALAGIRWCSFQVGRGDPLPDGWVNLAPVLTDFAETARQLLAMDLVITVDTAVAHLAGAMGRPVWLLLPFIPDWRWPLNGDRTPWYPSMRIFRQTKPCDWPQVVADVAAALAVWRRRFPPPAVGVP